MKKRPPRRGRCSRATPPSPSIDFRSRSVSSRLCSHPWRRLGEPQGCRSDRGVQFVESVAFALEEVVSSLRKGVPMPDVTPDSIMKIAMGFMAAKHLFAANEVGLFEALAAGPASIAELEEKINIPSRTLAIVANAMVSLGMLELEGEHYRNSDAASTFLAGRPGPDMRPMLRFWNRISYPTWQKLDSAVRTGEAQALFGDFSDEEQRIFSAGVESFTAPMAAALAAAYDFARHRRVLDVGGGTGSFLLAVLRRHTALEGTLFELTGASAVARQRLAREAEGARIEIVAGDLAKDPFPLGHDVLIVANTLPVLSAAHNISLLE